MDTGLKDKTVLITGASGGIWNETVATDQTSVFLCAREFFRLLERTRPEVAALVIVGSTAAVFGEEGHADYAAAKAGVRQRVHTRMEQAQI